MKNISGRKVIDQLRIGDREIRLETTRLPEEPEYPWLMVRIEGYGDSGSADGFGSPLMLEMADGRLRIIVWPDINKDEPTIIDLEGARESARKYRRVKDLPLGTRVRYVDSETVWVLLSQAECGLIAKWKGVDGPVAGQTICSIVEKESDMETFEMGVVG